MHEPPKWSLALWISLSLTSIIHHHWAHYQHWGLRTSTSAVHWSQQQRWSTPTLVCDSDFGCAIDSQVVFIPRKLRWLVWDGWDLLVGCVIAKKNESRLLLRPMDLTPERMEIEPFWLHQTFPRNRPPPHALKKYAWISANLGVVFQGFVGAWISTKNY